MTRGWWRRNVWGLLLVPPLLAGLFAFNADGFYDRNYRAQPKEPVPVDGTGRAALDDYAVRIMELAPVENELEIDQLMGFGQSAPPSSVKIWRAMLAIDAPRDETSTVFSCKSWLEDAAGRRYGANPAELGHAPHVFGGCNPDNEEQPTPYTTTVVFLLPAETRPTALVLTWLDRLPRYIRLPVAP